LRDPAVVVLAYNRVQSLALTLGSLMNVRARRVDGHAAAQLRAALIAGACRSRAWRASVCTSRRTALRRTSAPSSLPST
jgi:hypothetical protein